MWVLVGIIIVLLIIGINIGYGLRDWKYKKWVNKSKVNCPICKLDVIDMRIVGDEPK